MEGNFGGCKLWRICYKSTVGEINFGEFEFSIEQSILAEETLTNLWSFTKSANVSTLQSFPPYGNPQNFDVGNKFTTKFSIAKFRA